MALITKQLLAKPVKMREGEAAVIAVGLHGAVPVQSTPEHGCGPALVCLGAAGKLLQERKTLSGSNSRA